MSAAPCFLRPAVPPVPVAVGEEVALRLRITDPDGGGPKTGLKDVRVLTFLAPGQRQQRREASEVGDGVYEIRFRPAEEGAWFVFVEVASAGLPFQASPSLSLQAVTRSSSR